MSLDRLEKWDCKGLPPFAGVRGVPATVLSSLRAAAGGAQKR